MTSEHASPEFADLRSASAFLVRHWRDEFASLFGRALGRDVPRREVEPVVLVRREEILFGQDDNGQFAALARVPRNSETPRAFPAALARFGLSKADVILRIPGEEVLRPSLKLPNARPSALEGALRYELEHLTPLEPDDLYFDYAIAKRDRATNTVELAVRIIRKDLVDDAEALCRSAGLSVAAIGFEGDARETSWGTFPLDRPAYLRRLWRRHGNAALVGLAGILIALFLLAAFARGNAEIDALNDQVADEGAKAARVERISREISTTRRAFATLAREKREPLVVAVLAKLTHVLPDGTWLTEVEIDGNKVRIQGNSTSASDLIGRVDSSGSFANAQFDSPVVQDSALHADHFSMAFDVVGAAR